jgi:hypothetical protein
MARELDGGYEWDNGQELDGGQELVGGQELDYCDVLIIFIRLQRQVRDNSVSIEEAESPIAFPAKVYAY